VQIVAAQWLLGDPIHTTKLPTIVTTNDTSDALILLPFSRNPQTSGNK
jgi:hypothetical protein